ncbi:MAG: hypothetical protein MHM6MM_003547 [Cercozoa sp. M6MM]
MEVPRLQLGKVARTHTKTAPGSSKTLTLERLFSDFDVALALHQPASVDDVPNVFQKLCRAIDRSNETDPRFEATLCSLPSFLQLFGQCTMLPQAERHFRERSATLTKSDAAALQLRLTFLRTICYSLELLCEAHLSRSRSLSARTTELIQMLDTISHWFHSKRFSFRVPADLQEILPKRDTARLRGAKRLGQPNRVGESAKKHSLGADGGFNDEYGDWMERDLSARGLSLSHRLLENSLRYPSRHLLKERSATQKPARRLCTVVVKERKHVPRYYSGPGQVRYPVWPTKEQVSKDRNDPIGYRRRFVREKSIRELEEDLAQFDEALLQEDGAQSALPTTQAASHRSREKRRSDWLLHGENFGNIDERFVRSFIRQSKALQHSKESKRRSKYHKKAARSRRHSVSTKLGWKRSQVVSQKEQRAAFSEAIVGHGIDIKPVMSVELKQPIGFAPRAPLLDAAVDETDTNRRSSAGVSFGVYQGQARTGATSSVRRPSSSAMEIVKRVETESLKMAEKTLSWNSLASVTSSESLRRALARKRPASAHGVSLASALKTSHMHRQRRPATSSGRTN